MLQHQLGQQGIPAFGLWAQVPQYVAGSPSPPAVRALLGRVAELGAAHASISTPLDARCAEYTTRVEEGLSQRQDVAELVDRLEAATGGMPSGDELVSEIERFLRSQPDQDE